MRICLGTAIRAPLAAIRAAMSDLPRAEGRPRLRHDRSAATAEPFDLSDVDLAAALARLDRLAGLLDSAVVIPGTRTRIGADALLNLLPGIGPLLAKGLALYLVLEAHRLGAPAGTKLRMLGNLGLDALIGLVPVAGWIGDVFFRANDRNIDLLRAHLARETAARSGPVIDAVAA